MNNKERIDNNMKYIDFADKFEKLGINAIFIALPIIYFWFGGMKFTAYEAEGISGLVTNSPLMSWLYNVFSTQGFSNVLGTAEILVGLLILARFVNPKLSLIGGALSTVLFMGTLTFIASTPGVFGGDAGAFPAISIMPGQFLLKDIGLLAASLFVVGNSLKAMAINKPI